MRNLFIAVLLFVFPLTGFSQAVDINGKTSNPHELSGIWMRTGGDSGFSPAKDIPALTPAGQAKLKTTAILAPSRNPPVKKGSNPAESNDLALGCNPKGFPKHLLGTSHHYN